MRVDLNSDVGESYGNFKVGEDATLIPLISSANIACGFHAGDYDIMSETIALCIEHQVKIGAHIGFYDLHGFGRRKQVITEKSLKALVSYQLGALYGICTLQQAKIHHVKLHGALYNQVAESEALSRAYVECVKAFDESLILYVLSGSITEKVCEALSMRYYSEVFYDRNYTAAGTLVSRELSDAMLTDLHYAGQRIISLLKTGELKAHTGESIKLKADTICIHGDQPNAAEHASFLRTQLTESGVEIV